jgi:hypothetical protein
MTKVKILKISIGVLIFASLLYVNIVFIDPDLGWHIRVGDWIRENKSVPSYDNLSYTMPGYQWVDHEWLVNYWFSLMKEKNLWWAVVLVFAVLTSAPFLAAIIRAKSVIEFLIILSAVTFMLGFAGIRPQMISFFLFFVLFEILLRLKKNPNRLAVLVFLPIFFWVWANIHAGFFSGLILLAVFLVANTFMSKSSDLKTPLSPLESFFLLLASALTPLFNPYGADLYGEIFRVATSYETQKYISEWRPGLFVPFISSVPFLAFLFFFLWRYGKLHDRTKLLCGGAFFLMFLKSIRMGPLFLVPALSLAQDGAIFGEKEILEAQKNDTRGAQNINLKVFSLFFAAILAFLGFVVSEFEPIPQPQGAVIALKKLAKNKTIRIFNAYHWGGYLTEELPEVKVFIDGRMPHWVEENGNSAMKDYVKVVYGKKNEWQEVFGRRRINAVLITNEGGEKRRSELAKKSMGIAAIRALTNFLTKGKGIDLKKELISNGWQIIYEDKIAVLLVN